MVNDKSNELSKRLEILQGHVFRDALAAQTLKELNIPNGSIDVLPSKKPTRGLRCVDIGIETNLFDVKIDPNLKVYSYNVEINGRIRDEPSAKCYELYTVKGEPMQVINREIAVKLMYLFFKKNRQTVGDVVFYNAENRLFCSERFDTINAKFSVSELPELASLFEQRPYRFYSIKVSINSDVVTGSKETMNTLSDETSGIRDEFCKYIRCVFRNSLMTTNGLITFPNDQYYLIDPAAMKFRFDPSSNMIQPHYLAFGFNLGVNVIHNNNYGNRVVISVESKVTPFICEGIKVSSAMRSRFHGFPERRFEDVESYLQGLYVSYARPGVENQRTFRINRVAKPASQQIITLDGGKNLSVASYFKERYNLTIDPNLPVLVERVRYLDAFHELYYPMERCQFIDNQKVKKPLPVETQSIIKQAAVIPSNRTRDLNRLLNCFFKSDYPKSGISLPTDKPIKLTGKQIPVPQFGYEGGLPKYKDAPKVKYSFDTVNTPWAVVLIRDQQHNINNMRDFINNYVRMAKRMNIQMQNPVVFEECGGNALPQLFENLSSKGIVFVLFLTNERDKNIHPQIKKMEQTYDIITQNVTFLSISKGGVQTIENIVRKTNCKLGGLVHDIINPETNQNVGKDNLFIGIQNERDTNVGEFLEHKNITVIGYTANDMPTTDSFVGNYMYQEAGHEVLIQAIIKIVKECAKRYKQNNGAPKNVYLFRCGSTTDFRNYLLRYEIPAIRWALNAAGLGDSKLIVISFSRRHGVSLFRSQIPLDTNRASQQNLPPGTVADTEIVTPGTTNFFMISHTALQGTAKPVHYEVVYDEADLDLSVIESSVLSLCFCHQIVASPTSLPTPVYLAGEYAKRGRMVFNANKNEPFVASCFNEQCLNTDELNKVLSYDLKVSRDYRFNA